MCTVHHVLGGCECEVDVRCGRFFVLERKWVGTDMVPEEKFLITGSTGNVYTVIIGKQPVCNCPDAYKGNQCKHVIYVSHLSICLTARNIVDE